MQNGASLGQQACYPLQHAQQPGPGPHSAGRTPRAPCSLGSNSAHPGDSQPRKCVRSALSGNGDIPHSLILCVRPGWGSAGRLSCPPLRLWRSLGETGSDGSHVGTVAPRRAVWNCHLQRPPQQGGLGAGELLVHQPQAPGGCPRGSASVGRCPGASLGLLTLPCYPLAKQLMRPGQAPGRRSWSIAGWPRPFSWALTGTMPGCS